MAFILKTVSEQVQALYIAYFGRAAEPDGFNYWVGRLESGQMTFYDVAASFSVQPEALAQHPLLSDPSLNPGAFVDSLYAQLLNRAPDAEGRAYWLAQLEAAAGNHIAVGVIIAQFISGANGPNGDAATIQNKIAAGLYFTAEFEAAGLGGTVDGARLDPKYLEIARDVVDGDITSDPASIAIGYQEVDQFLSPVAPKPPVQGGGGNNPPTDSSAPVFTSAASAAVAENAPSSTVVYTAVATDNAAVTYSLSSGGDNDLFAIDPANGKVTFLAAPDFETPADADGDNIYHITVRASDGTNTSSLAVAISVTDIDETLPVFTSAASAAVAENVPSSTVVYTAVATDNAAVTYSLASGGDNDLFAIDPANGKVTFLAAPDFETPADADGDNIYHITIQASDGTNTSSLAVAISVTDIDETLPVFTSAGTASASEGISTTTPVYTAVATDNAAVTYGLASGGDNNLFNIDPVTGAVTFKVSPDYDAPADAGADNTYNITVTASDGVNTASLPVTIGVLPFDGTVPVFTSAASATTPENISTTTAVYTAVASDNATLTYGLQAGGDNDLFQIDPATGAVTFRTSPDFETPTDSNADNIYNITVTATDGQNMAYRAVAISVTDLNEIPVTVSMVLTTQNDYIAPSGLDTVLGAGAATLNPGDRLNGGDGYDVLSLFGGGYFRVDNLAEYTGFEEIRLNYASGVGPTGLTLGSGTHNVTVSGNPGSALREVFFGSGDVAFSSSGATTSSNAQIDFHFGSGSANVDASSFLRSVFNLDVGDATVIAGGTATQPGSFGIATNYFYLKNGAYDLSGAAYAADYFFFTDAASFAHATSIDGGTGNYTSWDGPSYPLIDIVYFSGGTYNLTSTAVTFANIEQFTVYSSASIVVDQALIDDLGLITIAGGGGLITDDATLDLTDFATIQAYFSSSNAIGTTFTVRDAAAAAYALGGAGDDTLVVTEATLTTAQRDAIFAQGSIDTITDQGGTYQVGSPQSLVGVSHTPVFGELS